MSSSPSLLRETDLPRDPNSEIAWCNSGSDGCSEWLRSKSINALLPCSVSKKSKQHVKTWLKVGTVWRKSAIDLTAESNKLSIGATWGFARASCGRLHPKKRIESGRGLGWGFSKYFHFGYVKATFQSFERMALTTAAAIWLTLASISTCWWRSSSGSKLFRAPLWLIERSAKPPALRKFFGFNFQTEKQQTF